MAKRRRRYLLEGDEGLNLTPLLDVIFNLIFFFVVATTIRTTESFLDLTLPSAREGTPQQETTPVPEVTVLRDGGLLLNGDPMAAEALVEALRTALETDDSQRVVLSADGEATVQQSVDAMDLIRQAGGRQVVQRVSEKSQNPAP